MLKIGKDDTRVTSGVVDFSMKNLKQKLKTYFGEADETFATRNRMFGQLLSCSLSAHLVVLTS